MRECPLTQLVATRLKLLVPKAGVEPTELAVVMVEPVWLALSIVILSLILSIYTVKNPA